MKLNSDILKAAIFTVIVFIVFGLYILFIGVPLTRARNLTNEAYDLIEKGDYSEALQMVTDAEEIQHSLEREKLIDELNVRLGSSM